MASQQNNSVELVAVLTSAVEGGFTALNPETGTSSQGETQDEALTNLIEATALYLEEFNFVCGQAVTVTTFRLASRS